MTRTTLGHSVIKSCAQYAQALMLMVGVAKQVPSFKSTLKDIYPRFVEEGGGEMHIHLGEYGYSLDLTSTENGIHKEIQLPLETTEPKDYLRHLWAYNTSCPCCPNIGKLSKYFSPAQRLHFTTLGNYLSRPPSSPQC